MVKKAKVVLSFDDNNRFASLVVLLIKVDKRMAKAKNDVKPKRGRPKKNSKVKTTKKKGSLICGPFFLYTHLLKIY